VPNFWYTDAYQGWKNLRRWKTVLGSRVFKILQVSGFLGFEDRTQNYDARRNTHWSFSLSPTAYLIAFRSKISQITIKT